MKRELTRPGLDFQFPVFALIGDPWDGRGTVATWEIPTHATHLLGNVASITLEYGQVGRPDWTRVTSMTRAPGDPHDAPPATKPFFAATTDTVRARRELGSATGLISGYEAFVRDPSSETWTTPEHDVELHPVTAMIDDRQTAGWAAVNEIAFACAFSAGDAAVIVWGAGARPDLRLQKVSGLDAFKGHAHS
jgi:hypothetical protein